MVDTTNILSSAKGFGGKANELLNWASEQIAKFLDLTNTDNVHITLLVLLSLWLGSMFTKERFTIKYLIISAIVFGVLKFLGV